MLDWKTATEAEKIDVLVPLAEQGASAGEMAQHFLNATRNATLGFCVRRKIKLGGSAASGGRKTSTVNANIAKRKAANEHGGLSFKLTQARKDRLSMEEGMEAVFGRPSIERVFGDDVPADRQLISLLELTERTCRWPYGDPHQPGFGFCGCRKGRDAGPYCPEHTAKAEAHR